MNQPRLPALYDTAPTPEQIAHVLVVLDKPIQYAPDSSSPSEICISPQFAISMIFVGVCLAIPLGVLLACWAIPSIPGPPIHVTLMCLVGAAAVYIAIASLNEYGKRLSPYMEIDPTSGLVSLPRYDVAIAKNDICTFTAFTSTYSKNEELMECSQFGVIARTPSGQFGYYDLAPVTSLDLRRVLRKLYSVPHWSYVDDDHGRARLLRVYDT